MGLIEGTGYSNERKIKTIHLPEERFFVRHPWVEFNKYVKTYNLTVNVYDSIVSGKVILEMIQPHLNSEKFERHIEKIKEIFK